MPRVRKKPYESEIYLVREGSHDRVGTGEYEVYERISKPLTTIRCDFSARQWFLASEPTLTFTSSQAAVRYWQQHHSKEVEWYGGEHVVDWVAFTAERDRLILDLHNGKQLILKKPE